uniref:Uncharacterized protein n=1 Tax=Anas platyrhynchos platyrhynchos TaxID=8840 RepID=A0A493TCM9_ANAPP
MGKMFRSDLCLTVGSCLFKQIPFFLSFPQSEDHLTAEPRIKKLEPILLPGRCKPEI